MKNILNLKSPIYGLSPIDGISDTAFRFITKKYSNPDIMFTEFTHVMGLIMAGDNTLEVFQYDESQRPIIAQIFGKEPEYFYHSAKIVCALGFDGVDINMGCPAKTVANSGSGASLIRTPELAKEIIKATQEGVKHWVENGQLTGLSNRTQRAMEVELEKKKAMLSAVSDQLSADDFTTYSLLPTPSLDPHGYHNLLESLRPDGVRLPIPVSVKTRIGYDVPITEKWISTVDSTDPAWITVHGRTLKQMYAPSANWDELKIAVESTDKAVMVNGDIKTKADVDRVLGLTNAFGVLVARASFGNPWIFNDLRNGEELQTTNIKLQTLLEHCEKFVAAYPNPRAFVQLRKHFGWYCKGFDNASELRSKLMIANSLDEVQTHIMQFSTHKLN
jgi:tRNA-dihydrouridine synthase B